MTPRDTKTVKEGRLTAGFRPLTQTTIEAERERQREGGLPTSHLGLLAFLFLNYLFSSFPPPHLLLPSVACRGCWMPGANEVLGCPRE